MGLDFFRNAAWLNAGRVRDYVRLLALLNIATLAWLLFTSHGGVDRNGFLLGTDFISFWSAGRMLHGGGHVYDVAAHIAAQRDYFASTSGHTAFFYPPLFLLACYPLGWLGYFPALALWLVASGAAYALVVRAWLVRMGIARSPLLLLAAFPAVLITVTHGQTALLVSALLGGGVLLVKDRPWLAGVLFGLATIKPQLGLLVPLVLLLTGEWKVIAGAAATVLALALVTTLAFGPHVWGEWLAVSGAAQDAMADGAIGFAKLQSVFAAARLLGAANGLALVVQGVAAFIVVAALVRAGWRRPYSLALGAAMLAGAPLVTPFVLDYDMALLAFPLIWLAAQQFRPWEKVIAALVFIAPAFARPLALQTGIPVMALLVAALFAVLVRRVIPSVLDRNP